MAYTQQQREFFQKAKAAGWTPEKIKAGVVRLGQRAAPQNASEGVPTGAPGTTLQGTPPVAPSAPQAADDGTGWMKGYSPAKEMGWGGKFAAGYGSAVPEMVQGTEQILASGEEEQALMAQEAKRREAMDQLGIPGKLGNIAGNIAATIPLAMASGGTSLLARLGIGAAEGAGTAALAPTAEEGERETNIKLGGGIGAAIPGLGAALRSKPFKAAGEFAADWNPFSYTTRLNKRNDAGRELVAAENAKLKQADVVDAAEHKAYVEGDARDYEAAVAGEADNAKLATAWRQRLEESRVAAENQAREDALNTARQEVAKRAGWSAVPTNRAQVEENLAAVGQIYADKLKPLKIDITGPASVASKAAATGGLSSQQSRALSGLAERMAGGSTKAGQMKGHMYKTLRSEITEELSDARGLYREQLLKTLKSMDKSFKDSVPDKAQYEEILKLRQQYSLGSKLRSMSFDPSQPMDVFKMQRHLDARGNDATGTRSYLTDVVSRTPKKPAKAGKIAAVEPTPVPKPESRGLPPVPREKVKFNAEESDYARLAVINGLLTFGTGPGHMLVAPALIGTGKAANNKIVSNAADRLTRAVTQSNLSDED